jgi:hypothetical protein
MPQRRYSCDRPELQPVRSHAGSCESIQQQFAICRLVVCTSYTCILMASVDELTLPISDYAIRSWFGLRAAGCLRSCLRRTASHVFEWLWGTLSVRSASHIRFFDLDQIDTQRSREACRPPLKWYCQKLWTHVLSTVIQCSIWID